MDVNLGFRVVQKDGKILTADGTFGEEAGRNGLAKSKTLAELSKNRVCERREYHSKLKDKFDFDQGEMLRPLQKKQAFYDEQFYVSCPQFKTQREIEEARKRHAREKAGLTSFMQEEKDLTSKPSGQDYITSPAVRTQEELK